MFTEINPNNLHHAYLLEGDRGVLIPELTTFLEKELNMVSKANPDFWVGEFDALSIDDARNFKQLQLNRPATNKKIFILGFNFATREAQNALLKVFEDTNQDTHLFLITPSIEILLPTLRSRMQILSRSKNNKILGTQAKKFIHASKAERLEIVKKLVESIADEEKGKMDAIIFVNELEHELHQNVPKDTTVKDGLSELVKCRGYLQDKSSSVKMILEHLALVL